MSGAADGAETVAFAGPSPESSPRGVVAEAASGRIKVTAAAITSKSPNFKREPFIVPLPQSSAPQAPVANTGSVARDRRRERVSHRDACRRNESRPGHPERGLLDEQRDSSTFGPTDEGHPPPPPGQRCKDTSNPAARLVRDRRHFVLNQHKVLLPGSTGTL